MWFCFSRCDLKITNKNKDTNANDGSRALRIGLGLYRFVCENGLIAGTSFFDERILHRGFTYEKLDEALKKVLEQSYRLKKEVEILQKSYLNADQLNEIANAFTGYKFNNNPNVTDLNQASLFRPERNDDFGQDAWTVLNVLQEKLIRGGVKYTYKKETKDDDGNVIKVDFINKKTRGTQAIDATVKHNQFAWDLVSKLVA